MSEVISVCDSDTVKPTGPITVTSLLVDNDSTDSDVEYISSIGAKTGANHDGTSQLHCIKSFVTATNNGSNPATTNSGEDSADSLRFTKNEQARESAASFLFTPNPATGKYRISRNIHASHVDVAPAPPTYFPTSAEGFATFVNLDGYNIRSPQEFVEGSPYSLRGRCEKKSTVTLCNGSKYAVWRKTVTCSGIKCCHSGVKRCSVPHSGAWKADPERDLYDDVKDGTDQEKAVQVFFADRICFRQFANMFETRKWCVSLRKWRRTMTGKEEFRTGLLK